MASKKQVAVPQQQRDWGIPRVQQQKGCDDAAGQDGKNRKALGDIGNQITVHGAAGAAVPRSFGAQLLANAQAAMAAAAAAAARKTVDFADGAAKKDHAREVKQKDITKVKPNPELVIEISPDPDEEMKQTSKSKTGSRSRSCSRKKNVHTLTSVLTARSKVACGISDRIKDLALDVDVADADDQLAAVDYVEDIYKFYKISENSSRSHDYMDSQVRINANMRAILADWLIEVHYKFGLTPEALYLTFNIIDRYLSMEMVLRRELQLVGVSAMLIASKYEEIWAPEVNDFMCISDLAYSREQILFKEKEILNKLEWSLTVPTPYVFLVRFLKVSMCDKEMEHMVFFFGELALMQYAMVMYCPSMIAASAIYAARCTLKKSPLWTEALKRHAGFSESQLLNCAQILVRCHSASPEGKLKVVYKKYSSSQFGAVALHQPAKNLLELKPSSLEGI